MGKNTTSNITVADLAKQVDTLTALVGAMVSAMQSASAQAPAKPVAKAKPAAGTRTAKLVATAPALGDTLAERKIGGVLLTRKGRPVSPTPNQLTVYAACRKASGNCATCSCPKKCENVTSYYAQRVAAQKAEALAGATA